jgi:peptidyl-prolyl cis-trans isomerase B (cyclophilin B)
VTSTKERQRAAARARLEREMANRAEAARRRRRLQLSIAGGVAVLLVAVGTVWLITNALGDDGKKGNTQNAAAQSCTWTTVPADQRTAQTVDVGTPPTNPARIGTKTMTITTNFGAVEVAMDLSKTPCTSASMAYLAGKKFFDGTKCHRMFEGVLQCGDPTAKGKGYRETDGTGGPAYRFGSENLPTDQRPAYPAGVVAMANSGTADSNGSQFFIVYKDVQLDPSYTILGRVTKGLDVVENATKAGDDGAYANSAGGGHPKNDVNLQSVTVS